MELTSSLLMTSLNSLFIRDTAMFAILNAYTYVDNFCVTKKNKRPQQFDVFLFGRTECLCKILSLSLGARSDADADVVAASIIVVVAVGFLVIVSFW